MGLLDLFNPVMNIGASIWGASSQASAARQAAQVMANASTGAANATQIEGERGSADLRNTANAAANASEQGGNIGRETILNAGNRSGEGTINAGTQGRDSILDSLKGLDQYSQAGSDALTRLTQGIGAGGEFSKGFQFDPNLMNDEGVKYRIAQGTMAIQNSASGKGLIGGNTARAIDDNAQHVASDEYSSAYARSLSSFSTNRAAAMDPLKTLIGYGQTADGQRIAGTTAAGQLDVNSHIAGGNAFTDAARAGTASQQLGLQSAGDFRTRAEAQAAQLRAEATHNAGLFQQDAGTALAGGKIGSANAFVGGLGNVAKTVSGIDWGKIFQGGG